MLTDRWPKERILAEAQYGTDGLNDRQTVKLTDVIHQETARETERDGQTNL
jgi:hypothetical protein